MEKFVNIKGYDGYQISDHGRVYSGKSKKILRAHENSNGYLRVVLNRKQLFIHRLVAEHFCIGRKDGLIVHHNDRDRLNNHASNLRWTTQSENCKLAVREYRPERKAKAKLSWDKVAEIRRSFKYEKLSAIKLGLIYGVDRNTIYGIVKNQTWRT